MDSVAWSGYLFEHEIRVEEAGQGMSAGLTEDCFSTSFKLHRALYDLYQQGVGGYEWRRLPSGALIIIVESAGQIDCSTHSQIA
jgi:hypothetical protein